MQRTIRAAAGVLAMAAACLSATAQAPVNSATEPLPRDRRSLALDRQIAALVAQPAAARAHWGVIVTRLDGAPIYALNEGQLFHPASNAKLFTTAAAMALLPPTHVFTTTVTGGGFYLEDGTLRGNLYLHGVGDANLSGRDLPYVPPALRPNPAPPANDPLRYLEELADQVKSSGVKRVEGNIDGSAKFPWQPYPAGWSTDDLVWGYAAPVSGLSVADNELKLTISP